MEKVDEIVSLFSKLSPREKKLLSELLFADFSRIIPTELLIRILSYLNPSQLCRLGRVSSAFYRLSIDEQLWKSHCNIPANIPYSPATLARDGILTGSLPRSDEYPNWKQVYKQQYLLRKNWKTGHYNKYTLNGHSEAIYCLQFDNKKIITGSKDCSIKIWDLDTIGCSLPSSRTLRGHTGSVLCLAFKDNTLASGSSDCSVLVWDLAALSSPPIRLVGHAESVLNIVLYSDSIVSCSKDKTIKIWRQNLIQHTLIGHRAAVNSIQVKNNLIISGSGDRLIKIWNLNDGTLINTISGHSRGIACIQFDGTRIASGSSDKTVMIWDLHGTLLHTLSGHMDLVRTIQFKDNLLISGSYDSSIKLWDIPSQSCVLDLLGHDSRVFKVAFDVRRVVSCSQDSRIIVWDFGDGLD